jgi:hypothetical protein
MAALRVILSPPCLTDAITHHEELRTSMEQRSRPLARARRICPAFLLSLLPLHLAAAEKPVTLHVAPGGNDGWSGLAAAPSADRSDGPLASLEGARDRIRRLRKEAGGKLGAVTVFVAGGVYRLERPFVLEPEDSGSAGAPVVYRARDGERPVLSGGHVLGGFREKGRLWECDVPEAKAGRLYFRQLFAGGARRQRARAPDPPSPTTAARPPMDSAAAVPGPGTAGTQGYFRIAELLPGPPGAKEKEPARDRFRFRPGDIRPWANLGDANVVLYHSWETSIHPVKSVDLAANVVEFTAPLKEWWTIGYWEKAARYHVENALDLLDRPGEWYLDRTTGVLSYFPLPGEKIGETEVVVPVLGELVRIAGRAEEGRWVEGVRIEGLAFHHADWALAPGGNSSTQAAVEVPAAVVADGARECSIAGCEVAHVGTYGIWLRRGCKGCRVERNRLHDLGAGGVRVGEDRRAAIDAAESTGNFVGSNHIFDGGRVYPAGVGIWVAQSSGNRISHNEIHDLLYTGISIGWNWDDAENRCRDNVIELNHVHHLVNGVLSDAGAIYCLGRSPESVIRRNHFHDVWPYGTPPFGWGIYLDATCSGYLVEENVVHDIRSGGMMESNGGHEHVIRNNIFALGADYALWPFFEKRPNEFRRNIVYLTQGEVFVPFTERTLLERIGAKESLGVWDENLYWHSGGADRLRFFRRTFEDWRALGIDARSAVADPRFADPEARDFRLLPDSPALRLGFRPIDLSGAGLSGDAAWVEEGRKVRHPKTVLPAPPAPPAPPEPKEVNDGFEGTEPGSGPAGAQASGEEKGASIRVTEERAAAGKRSLKVTDSKALEPSWQPHFYYEPHILDGRVRQSFDIRLGRGCRLFTEWRDATPYPENVGPSVAFDEDGNVSAGGKTAAKVPIDEWIHVEIEGALGKDAPRTFRLAVGARGSPPQVVEGLPFAGKLFRELHWLGFSSTAAADASFYLDDMRVERR